MASGKLGEFDVVNGSWCSYCDRLEMYFLVNKVTEELKVPTLISVIGDAAYELMMNLSSPKKPSELKFDDVKKMMQSHLVQNTSVLAERYHFRQRRQHEGQTISEYVGVLKKMARYCDFGATLNENLRDQFVCGLIKEGMRQRLFAMDEKMDLEKAVKLAKTIETAEKDSMSIQGGACGSFGHAVDGTVSRDPDMTSRSRRSSSQRLSIDNMKHSEATMHKVHVGGACSACGDRRHHWKECRFRMYECDHCTRSGHLKRMCPELMTGSGSGYGAERDAPRGGGSAGARPARGRGVARWRTGGGRGRWPRHVAHQHYVGDQDSGSQTTDEDYDDEPVMQMSLKEYIPVSLLLSVGNSRLNMEIDTGSALSCISKEVYEKEFHRFKLLPCQLTISFYDGTKVRPLGYIEVNVKYKNVEKNLDLYVIDKGTTTLLGRQWLAELNIEIPKFTLNKIDSVEMDKDKLVNDVISRYNEVFDGGLGRFTDGKATLRVRADAEPVFCRARPLPYALRERVDAELDAMLAAGVIEPVDCSDWATPLVIVSKADGGIRICADFKVTLNRVLAVDKYPLPKIEDLLSNLGGSRYFSKLDLSQAYNQVELDESKRYTVINTHRGLFMYNRLVYGLASSPGIFQRVMTNILSGIPNVVVFLDDILIYGKTVDSHLLTLNAVLERLQSKGLKIKREKCTFFTEKVKYLGFIIGRNGTGVDSAKIKPILNMAEPKNVSELRTFLGMVNFYGKFVKNLSFYINPLNTLLQKNKYSSWGQREARAFETVKRLLAETPVLGHYDASRPLVVTCNASAHGLGAVLAQVDAAGRERPVAYASRALNKAETNYSQIHKEALAIVYAVKKFHQYLFGREFKLRTDHKPLLSIFNPSTAIPSMTASRLQRWAITLSAYRFNIEYVSSDKNTADALSRMIATYREESAEAQDDGPEQTYLHFASEALLLDNNMLRKETSRDPLLSRVLGYIKEGWPSDVEIKELKPYFNRKSELYVELGCVMWGHRVIVPNSCRGKVLKELHDSHMGIVRTKSIARSYVWWPGLDEAVENKCRACTVCAQTADAPAAHAPRSWHWPDRAWSRLNLDFLGPISGVTYLVVVDACSKWIEIAKMTTTTASSVVNKLREIWSRFGIPKQVVSDNGPPFTSEEFENFLHSNGVDHMFSAPYHPSSNGAAESAVKICKKIIKKAQIQKQDVDTALCRSLLIYRNTEHSTTGETPAQLLQGRTLRMRLDCVKPDRERHVRAAQRRQQQAAGGTQRTISDDAHVWYRTYRPEHKWAKGRVMRRLGDTDYELETNDGKRIHRHIDQIKRYTECNLEDHMLAYPPLANNESGARGDPKPGSMGSGAPVAASSSSGPTRKGGVPRGGGGCIVSPRSVRIEQPVDNPSLSVGERSNPMRMRKPPVRFGFEID